MTGRRPAALLASGAVLFALFVHAAASAPRGVTRVSFPWGLPLGGWKAESPWTGVLLYLACMAGLFAVYALALRWLSQARQGAVRRVMLFGGPLLFGAILLLTPAMLSRDLLDDMGHGRLLAHYGVDPYSTRASALAPDEFTGAMGRPGSQPLAGPAWVSVAALVCLAGGGSFAATVLAFKALLLAVHLINGALLLGLARRWSSRPRSLPPAAAAGLYLWNPLVLTMTVADGRHEAAALCWMLLGLWLLARGEEVMGSVAAAMAPLSDPMMAPLWALVVAQRAREAPRRGALAAGIGAATAALAYLPYVRGMGWEHFLPPYHLPAEPGGLLVALQIALGWMAGPAAGRLAQLAWYAAMAGMAVWLIRASARTLTPADVPGRAAGAVLYALLSGAAVIHLPLAGWCVGLAALAVEPRLRKASVALSAAALSLQALGIYRTLLPEPADPLPAARVAASLVAAGLPLVFLLPRTRIGPGGAAARAGAESPSERPAAL
ncbi:MAG TPA: hypothetical protein VJV23_11000 [Candidatus Polarisedimenticolia bacterium]|nr:hypothetical protein [Candidatus Polarisedimenticolia bacterium]